MLAKRSFAPLSLFCAATADGAVSANPAAEHGARRPDKEPLKSRWLKLKLDQRLIDLHARKGIDQLSFAEIAAALNAEFGMHMSRNAVIGRAGRMHLPPRTSYRTRQIVRRVKAENKQLKAQPHMTAKPRPQVAPQTPPRNISLLELGPHDCRYPFGDYPPFLFCGLPTVESSPWCPKHFKLCHNAAYLAARTA